MARLATNKRGVSLYRTTASRTVTRKDPVTDACKELGIPIIDLFFGVPNIKGGLDPAVDAYFETGVIPPEVLTHIKKVTGPVKCASCGKVCARKFRRQMDGVDFYHCSAAHMGVAVSGTGRPQVTSAPVAAVKPASPALPPKKLPWLSAKEVLRRLQGDRGAAKIPAATPPPPAAKPPTGAKEPPKKPEPKRVEAKAPTEKPKTRKPAPKPKRVSKKIVRPPTIPLEERVEDELLIEAEPPTPETLPPPEVLAPFIASLFGSIDYGEREEVMSPQEEGPEKWVPTVDPREMREIKLVPPPPAVLPDVTKKRPKRTERPRYIWRKGWGKKS